nr:DUF2293 domain-containing protein [uncultured Desulfobulbus sp.]
MEKNERYLWLGRDGNPVDDEGKRVEIPSGWGFLPAGDAGLTRKITARKQFWRLQIKKGRRVMSKGIWAPQAIIDQAQAEVEAQRSSPEYQQRLAGQRRRREAKQEVYAQEFLDAVRGYLNFAPCYREVERVMAAAIANHAVPVGSGTVARTTRIPLEERASRAVIAWMRHQTTAYDGMSIARIKGERRRVRRMLALRSTELLKAYREGMPCGTECPLQGALKKRNPTDLS